MMSLFEEIYSKAFSNFKSSSYHYYDSDVQNQCDTALYLGNISFVEVIKDEKDPEDEYNNRLVFKYDEKFYACTYRQGSHGNGINFYPEDLKEVFPKIKEVIFYE